MFDKFESIPNGAKAVLGIMAALGPVMMLLGQKIPGFSNYWVITYITLGSIAGLGAYVHHLKSKKDSED